MRKQGRARAARLIAAESFVHRRGVGGAIVLFVRRPQSYCPTGCESLASENGETLPRFSPPPPDASGVRRRGRRSSGSGASSLSRLLHRRLSVEQQRCWQLLEDSAAAGDTREMCKTRARSLPTRAKARICYRFAERSVNASVAALAAACSGSIRRAIPGSQRGGYRQ